MKKPLIFTTATIALLFAFGCSSNKKDTIKTEDNGIDTISVTVVEASTGNFTEIGRYYGSVSAINSATLITYTGGQVSSVKYKEGQWVKKGSSLAKVDAAKAQSLLEMAKLNEQIAKSSFERAEKQFEKENISKVMRDQAELGWVASKKDLIDARKAWRGALCISPMNGIVTSRFINTNQELAPGSPTFTVSNTKKLKINIGIPESEIAGVKIGNKAEVTFDLIPGRIWEGKITRLSGEITGGRVFNAEVVIDNKDDILKPGFTAYVKVERQILENKIIVPTDIILTESTHNFVMTASNGVAKYKKITLGSSDETNTVLESGIVVGELLIRKGNSLVSDNTPIKIIEQEK